MKKNKKLFLKILCYIFLNVIIFNSYAYADMMPIYSSIHFIVDLSCAILVTNEEGD